MSSVFLSHSHKDKDFVDRLAVDLRRHGHVVWVDEAEIDVGDSLVEKIREGIDRVDYVAAVISKASAKSSWVARELDLATNRELAAKKVVVLPLLLDNAKLPGFLKGKLFADFRPTSSYKKGFQALLRRLGKTRRQASLSVAERRELSALRDRVDFHQRDSDRRTALVRLRRSRKTQAEIDQQNATHPEWAHINNAYAFEVMGIPVTVGYTLHSMRKEEQRGSSPLSMALEMEGKWPEFNALVSAMADFMNSKRRRDG